MLCGPISRPNNLDYIAKNHVTRDDRCANDIGRKKVKSTEVSRHKLPLGKLLLENESALLMWILLIRNN